MLIRLLVRIVVLFTFLWCNSASAEGISFKSFSSSQTLSAEGRAVPLSVLSIEYKPSQEIKKEEEFTSRKWKYEEVSLCASVSKNYFGNATHPGGRGYKNERNDGLGMTCYLDDTKNYFVFANALINSQYGLSIATGVGRGVTIIDLWGARLDAGMMLTGLSYETKRTHKVVYGVLPLPYIKATYQLPGMWGSLGLMQTYLGRGVTLRNAEIQVVFSERF